MTKIVVKKPKEKDSFQVFVILSMLLLLTVVAAFALHDKSSGEDSKPISRASIPQGVADDGWQTGYYDGYAVGEGHATDGRIKRAWALRKGELSSFPGSKYSIGYRSGYHKGFVDYFSLIDTSSGEGSKPTGSASDYQGEDPTPTSNVSVSKGVADDGWQSGYDDGYIVGNGHARDRRKQDGVWARRNAERLSSPGSDYSKGYNEGYVAYKRSH